MTGGSLLDLDQPEVNPFLPDPKIPIMGQDMKWIG